jgi:aspartate/methionine/tyrosine aminotransferase
VVHKNHISLSEVAKDYKDLDWIELFSISKTLSACGWRV